MKKQSRFWTALSSVLMVPSFLIFLVIFFVEFEHDYIHWSNGEMFWFVDSMYCLMIFCFILFCVGAVLLLTTLYILDKEQGKKSE